MSAEPGGARGPWRAEWAQTLRWWPVAFGTRTTLILLGEFFFALMLFTGVLLDFVGSDAIMDRIIKISVIIPSLIVVALCTADTVPDLRAKGELELAVTLSRPLRLLLHRMLPAIAVSLGQAILLLLAMAFLVKHNGWQVVFGLAALPIPLLFALAASLLWNLVLRGPGAVLTATLVTLVPAVIWIRFTPLVLAGRIVVMGDQQIPFLKALLQWSLCQGGILAGAVGLAILALHRLGRTEKLLHE